MGYPCSSLHCINESRATDPACGSGNFLTETYISLRKLENEAIEFSQVGGQFQMAFEGDLNPIKVSINQFYGIEINDFAVVVAKTALWIAEHQMMKETEKILIGLNDDFLPLHTYANIVEGNALKMNWNDVVDKRDLNYIMGNPPFIGASNMDKKQKKELMEIFKDTKKSGDLDYVTGWYKIASNYMNQSKIQCAFVSTNSICQGEQPTIFWKPLMNKGIKINFAYRTFVWNSEANSMAHVHCIIVGFSYMEKKDKFIFENNKKKIVNHINGQLLDIDDIFIESFSKPLCNKTKMIRGSSPCDNGNYSLTLEEKNDILSKYPELEVCIKEYIGAKEFINRIPRYCFWFKGIDPKIYRNNPEIKQRIENVKNFRLSRTKKATVLLAQTPLKWEADRYNGKDYILIPRVSSQRREYIPIGFMDGNTIGNDAVQLIPNATLYDFGILNSNIHMVWMRMVAGRLKSDYRYSNLVYNSFAWPDPSENQIENIKNSAQEILDARNLYPDSSLADLYDPDYMPEELRKAHKDNDKAVMKAYGFEKNMSEADIVSELMKMYQELTK
ncbi:MAG: N-6 DNA methylase, partial [Erysipelotrichaceae bacterium]|nr:N-6 DNA methylase [Erysipelotrichaceae bacterium]